MSYFCIIFKGKRNGKIENDLKKDNKNYFIGCNNNAWATEDIMIDWFNNIWKAYLYNNNDFNEDKIGYQIIDQATSHINPNVLS